MPKNLDLLLESGRLLSSKLELSELLNTVMRLAARVVDAETASLLLVDEQTDELYFDVALGLAPEVAAIRLKMGQGIAGQVAEKGAAEIINDVEKDSRWTSNIDESSGFKTRSILAAPLMMQDRRIGVIEAINCREGNFDEEDLRVFEAFASQAAIAIENARLFANLREERLKLSTLIDEMQEAAVLTDGKGGIVLANKPSRQLFGENMVQGQVADVLDGWQLTPPLEDIVYSTAPVIAFEAVREEPKKLILAGTASTFHNEAGQIDGRVVVFRDVTVERQEAGLKRNFLSLISHKLKTPLASINGYSQLLLDDMQEMEDSDFKKKSIKTISTQGAKLTGLVEKLLNYTTLEDFDTSETAHRTFSIDDTVREAITALEPWIIEQGGSTDFTITAGLSASGDPLLIRDAVKNLIENAIKFSPEGKRQVKISTTRAGGAVEICITDNGPGIPPEELERVFGKFYQIDTSFTGQIEGWGLGLTFARRVLENFSGALRLESKPGEGTTATASLPSVDL
jgi:signal transduction histidine kinase/putative methionine-R-sulfoxide reductase with GAF domain